MVMYWLMFSTYFATFFNCSSGTIDCWAPWQQLHSQPPEYGHRQAFIWIDGKKWELWIRWLCCDGAPDWIWEAQWTWRPARHGIGEILLLENSLSCADEVLQVEVYIPVFKKLFFFLLHQIWIQFNHPKILLVLSGSSKTHSVIPNSFWSSNHGC